MVKSTSADSKTRVAEQQALKLMQSVHLKDINRINKLIANGVPDLVNIRDPEGITGIHIAVCANDQDIINLLCEFGADCNVIDNNGRTVYMKAAALGHIEVLDLLLSVSEYPDLDCIDKEGRHILYFCLHNTTRHQLCFKLALEYGVDVNVVGKDGKPLLFQACELRLTDIMTLLLEAGADVNGKNKQSGETTLHIPCRAGDTNIARLLLAHGANPNICDKKNIHCAHKAAKSDHLDILQLLSAYGANLGSLDRNQDTPLHIAAHKGAANVCKFLGQRGCWATLKNGRGYIPRVVAKNNGHKLAMKACKKAEKNKGSKPGTEFNIVRFYDWLQENKEGIILDVKKYQHEEVGKIRNEDMITILKKRKSPLDEESLMEIIHLHDLLYEGVITYETFLNAKKFIHKSILIKPGKKGGKGKSEGKKGGRRKDGTTKIEFPICTNNKLTCVRPQNGGPLANFVERQELVTDRFRFDRDHQPSNQINDDSYWYVDGNIPAFVHINNAVRNGDKETLKAAIRKGYDVNGKDRYYKSPLMHACLDGNYKLAKFLVDSGADVNAVDNFKWSAIHFACHSGQRDIVELLINNGADVDSQTLNGGVPLMRAIESANADVVQLLIDREAKVHIETKKGLKPLDIAKSYSDARIISMIEKRIAEVPPPVIQRKRKFSPIKGGTNKVGTITPTVLPDIKQSKTILLPPRPQNNPLARSASGIEKYTDEEPVTFQVQTAWLPQLNTQELLSEKENMRERFGCEIDFEGYKPPFQRHIDGLVNNLDADDT